MKARERLTGCRNDTSKGGKKDYSVERKGRHPPESERQRRDRRLGHGGAASGGGTVVHRDKNLPSAVGATPAPCPDAHLPSDRQCFRNGLSSESRWCADGCRTYGALTFSPFLYHGSAPLAGLHRGLTSCRAYGAEPRGLLLSVSPQGCGSPGLYPSQAQAGVPLLHVETCLAVSERENNRAYYESAARFILQGVFTCLLSLLKTA